MTSVIAINGFVYGNKWVLIRQWTNTYTAIKIFFYCRIFFCGRQCFLPEHCPKLKHRLNIELLEDCMPVRSRRVEWIESEIHLKLFLSLPGHHVEERIFLIFRQRVVSVHPVAVKLFPAVKSSLRTEVFSAEIWKSMKIPTKPGFLKKLLAKQKTMR